jgi:hypothetical protein
VSIIYGTFAARLPHHHTKGNVSAKPFKKVKFKVKTQGVAESLENYQKFIS